MSVRTMLSRVFVGLILMWATPLCTAAQPVIPAQPAPQPSAAPANADQSYVLGPQDIIEVAVIGHQDFTSRVKIEADGTVQLPYLGTVQAANRTTEQLGDQLAKALVAGGFFANPIMRVDIADYAQPICHRAWPGDDAQASVPIDRPYHLSEILARVGGVRDSAADYIVLRTEKGDEQHYSIKALATGDLSQDPMVAPGDKIYSPAAEIFYISGQVKSPGAYGLMADMTLRMAIARAGGLTDLGTDRAVQVTRDGKKLGHLDLDSQITPGDVIVVGERLF